MYSIEENRLLIIYDSNYYVFTLNKCEIKSSLEDGTYSLILTIISNN